MEQMSSSRAARMEASPGKIAVMCQVRSWAKLKEIPEPNLGYYITRMSVIYGSEFSFWFRGMGVQS